MGRRRASNLPDDLKIVSCYDSDSLAALKVANMLGIKPSPDVERLYSSADAVLIATTNCTLVPLAMRAIEHNIKHIFIEKPGGINVAQMIRLRAVAESAGAKVCVGYTLEHHTAIRQMIEDVTSGRIGPVMYIRARYGHGARPNYDREWRAIPEISGGGHLIDQGVHLIHLVQRLLGETKLMHYSGSANYWQMQEDNAFLVMAGLNSDDQEARAFLHTSCTEWVNKFSFEVIGRTGKAEVYGLGGSYGPEVYRLDAMGLEPRIPDRSVITGMDGTSIGTELLEWSNLMNESPANIADLRSAISTMRIVEKAYNP